MISNINYVKNVMKDLRAKKKYGQNFLIDLNIVEKIAKSACDKDLKTLEIGPGLGALTEQLLRFSKSVDAYEIDKDMYELLTSNLHDDNLNVYLTDFLDVDLSIYKEKINICANLPYYVTTPILFKIIESNLDFNKMTIMVQKEVADRLSAKVNSEDYGALSIEVQYLYDVKLEMNVSRKVFYPEPNVDSAIISFVPKKERDYEFEKELFELIKNSFRMRRKTLNNNLKDIYTSEQISMIFSKCNLKENVRAQELSVDDFINIYKVIKNNETKSL